MVKRWEVIERVENADWLNVNKGEQKWMHGEQRLGTTEAKVQSDEMEWLGTMAGAEHQVREQWEVVKNAHICGHELAK